VVHKGGYGNIESESFSEPIGDTDYEVGGSCVISREGDDMMGCRLEIEGGYLSFDFEFDVDAETPIYTENIDWITKKLVSKVANSERVTELLDSWAIEQKLIDISKEAAYDAVGDVML